MKSLLDGKPATFENNGKKERETRKERIVEFVVDMFFRHPFGGFFFACFILATAGVVKFLGSFFMRCAKSLWQVFV